MPITGQPTETTPARRLGSHPQLQGEFDLFCTGLQRPPALWGQK